MFQPLPSNVRFPLVEEEILKFWRDRGIYDKSLSRRADAPPFVFYEGPPTANGMPHPGHCLTRAMKDLFPRYRTMQGFRCERKAGWDTHGLPVEVEVCKELGIHSKEEIEAFGIEPFIHRCQQSVWRYMQEWERLTERIGFWIHLDDAYVTYHQSYVESVWWSLKNLFERGLLYQGHKIVWWWAQGGTALSSGEVGQGYREVADPSVFVRFPLLSSDGEERTSLLVWTTTPWTLPSNQFTAVHPDIEYVTVRDEKSHERLILAADLIETIAEKGKCQFEILDRCQGQELVGKRYHPPFDYFHKELGAQTGTLLNGEVEAVAWRVVAADFVTVESGSGVVHQAPAFGEVDYDVLVAEQSRFEGDEGPSLINAVGPDGRFTAIAGEYSGRWVKDTDKDIARELRQRGLLFHQEQYLHDYPFCWRASEDPLIQYPRESWFIKTTSFKDRMVENNEKIQWLPGHIRDGRMGNFLASNVDWALSRERYWGTPLPIWVCDVTGKQEAVDSYEELTSKPGVCGTEVWLEAKAKDPQLPDDLRVHKPYIDAVTYDSPFSPGGRMVRVPEVIDCWYDSGAMPFAQWGYPHQNRARFESQFPADFISEAIDQTRGWFYSQLAISTMLFGEADEQSKETGVATPHPFRTCIVLGLMLAEWWESKETKELFLAEDDARKSQVGEVSKKVGKMSKQLRNYRSPQEIFDTYGADALRWYFFANQAPWNSIIYSERAIKESIPEFLLRLWNCYSFFVIYANIDNFSPSKQLSDDIDQADPAVLGRATGYRDFSQRNELDRWILSELHCTVQTVVDRMDAYDNYGAATALNAFVDGLSNWYVRRSRDRFWSSDKQATDKLDAYWTLYECLLTTVKLIAPFTPFLSEAIWRNLVGEFGSRALESVHLCDYPSVSQGAIDQTLSDRMRLLREIASLGLSARMGSKLKVRQPLARVEVILVDTKHRSWLEEHGEILRQELNVKDVSFTDEPDRYISYQIQPNFKRLGPRVGKRMPQVKKVLVEADASSMLRELEDKGAIVLKLDEEEIRLDSEDIQIRLQAKEGWAAAQGSGCVVVLSTTLTDKLLREGYARDLVRLIQEQRKTLGCDYTDRISIGLDVPERELLLAVEENEAYIRAETLAEEINYKPLIEVAGVEKEIATMPFQLFIKVPGDSE